MQETSSMDGPKCSICGKHFDDMAEMQRHSLTEHIKKGDLPGMHQKQFKVCFLDITFSSLARFFNIFFSLAYEFLNCSQGKIPVL
jgi:hypothetical protein